MEEQGKLKAHGPQWKLLVGTGLAAVVTLSVAACEDFTGKDFELPEPKPFEAGVSTLPSGIDAASDSAPSPEADAAPDAEADVTAPPACNDGEIGPGETCDPLASCPTSCPPIGCTLRALENGGTCMARCIDVAEQTACVNGDGCCPPACNASNDDDCKAVCDNRVIEEGETCDPLASCPTSCPPIGCQLRTLQNAGTCKAECVNTTKIEECKSGDGCCPANCNANNDAECGAGCGNNVVEPGETCDPLASCPTTCPPIGCQLRKLVNAGTCQAECVDDVKLTACINNDGCCPAGCNANNDNDCKPQCDNGVVERGEKCDPLASCPTSCAQLGCDIYTLDKPGTCEAQCVKTGVQNKCIDNDGCCPAGCNATNDNNCNPQCGNGVVEPGETCDPKQVGSCPTCGEPIYTCFKKQTGDPSTCDVQCNVPILTCSGKVLDKCCPFGKGGSCGATTDPDCAGDKWSFVKIGDFDSTGPNTPKCKIYQVEDIVERGSYAITTCSPTGGASGDTVITSVKSRSGNGTMVTYGLASNNDCTDELALPRLAGWDCRSTTVKKMAMSCATPSPGGFMAIDGAVAFEIEICANSGGLKQPPPEALGVAPVYIWYNAPKQPKPVSAF
jgi:hypothetical protein